MAALIGERLIRCNAADPTLEMHPTRLSQHHNRHTDNSVILLVCATLQRTYFSQGRYKECNRYLGSQSGHIPAGQTHNDQIVVPPFTAFAAGRSPSFMERKHNVMPQFSCYSRYIPSRYSTPVASHGSWFLPSAAIQVSRSS